MTGDSCVGRPKGQRQQLEALTARGPWQKAQVDASRNGRSKATKRSCSRKRRLPCKAAIVPWNLSATSSPSMAVPRGRRTIQWLLQEACTLRRIARPTLALAFGAVLPLAGCGTTQRSVLSTVGETVSHSPVAVQTIAPEPKMFVSHHYGYRVTLPLGWIGVDAFHAWDGIGAPGAEALTVDKFAPPTGQLSSFAYAAPFAGTLDEWVTSTLTAASAEHACPETAETNEQISIGAEAGRLLGLHCPPVGGLFVLTAVSVHAGTGYVFVIQDPSRTTSDDALRVAFVELLGGIEFPPT